MRILVKEGCYALPPATWGFTYIINPKIFDKDPPLTRRFLLGRNESLPTTNNDEGGVLRPPP